MADSRVDELDEGTNTSAPLHKVSSWCTGAAAAIGICVLWGWILDVRVLKSVLPQFTTMKANAALCILLTAAAIWLSRSEALRRRYQIWIWILVAVVSITALLTASEYLFHWNAGLDELLFYDFEHSGVIYPPGRFAPGTALCLLLLSGALLALDRRPLLSHGLALAVVLVSLIGLIAYLYNLPTLYGASRYTSMALHTVFGFLCLSLGLLATRPRVGLTALLVESRAQGSHTHSLVLGAVLLPMLLGSVALAGQQLGWYGSEFTLAFFSVMLIVLSVTLVWVTAGERQKVEGRRRQTEAALRESEERFRAIADNIPVLAWMANADGHIFWYNRRWYEFTGTTFEQMEGWGWQSVHDKDMLPVVMGRWRVAIETGMPFEMVFPLRGADGVFRPVLTRIQPVKEDGRVVRWFGTNTDISAERKTQEDLRKANRELEEYAYVSSHDLQEPLRMVYIYTDLLMRELADKLEGRTKQYAVFVQDGVKRMERLIQDLLQFSRTVTSRAEDGTSGARADLNICLQKALAGLATRVAALHAEVKVGALPEVAGEESALTQVFQNLLTNALKYRSKTEQPVIEISSRLAQNEWITCVRDNGIGFEPQYAERIFGLFKRLHKEEYPGTGLGLAICQRIVERCGGRMWAESSLGNGASFFFALPYVTPVRPVAETVEAEQSGD